jgi:rRNA-processing protein FCF1
VEALLDTNFIIACIKRNIDFLDVLESKGFKPVLAHEVYQELKDLRATATLGDRVALDIALTLFERRKVHKMTLGHRKVDEGLILKGKQGAYIATLDAGIKRVVPSSIGISNASNTLDITRQ